MPYITTAIKQRPLSRAAVCPVGRVSSPRQPV